MKQHKANTVKQRKLPAAEDMAAAKRWWHGLNNGQKAYIKTHNKMGDDVLLTRYWLANIKACEPAGAQ